MRLTVAAMWCALTMLVGSVSAQAAEGVHRLGAAYRLVQTDGRYIVYADQPTRLAIIDTVTGRTRHVAAPCGFARAASGMLLYDTGCPAPPAPKPQGLIDLRTGATHAIPQPSPEFLQSYRPDGWFSVGKYWLYGQGCPVDAAHCGPIWVNWRTGEYRAAAKFDERLDLDSPDLAVRATKPVVTIGKSAIWRRTANGRRRLQACSRDVVCDGLTVHGDTAVWGYHRTDVAAPVDRMVVYRIATDRATAFDVPSLLHGRAASPLWSYTATARRLVFLVGDGSNGKALTAYSVRLPTRSRVQEH